MASDCRPIPSILLPFAPNPGRMTTDAIDTNGESDDNVRVVVRVRPFNNGEVDAGYREIVHVDPIHGTIK